MSDVSIIIQGPLNEISLKNIPTYKKYGKVIVSCWDGYDEELLKYIDNDVCFVSKTLPIVNHYNHCNVYYQASSIYSGLEKAKTEFSIKFRSDESYSNLDTFVKALIENPECIITGDIYFDHREEQIPLHISDHAIGSKTKNLLGTFDRVKDICETTPPSTRMAARGKDVLLPPEPLIMLSFLQEIGAAVKSDGQTIHTIWGGRRTIIDNNISRRSVELIKNHARIVPTIHMGDVFLNTHGNNPSLHGRPIKSGSEELRVLTNYGGRFVDIKIGCES